MTYEERLSTFQVAKFHEASGNMTAAEVVYDKLIKEADFSPTSTKEDHQIIYESYHRKLILNLNKRGVAMSLAPTIIEIFHKDKELQERALFDVAGAYIRIGETEAASDLLVKFIHDYPQSKQLAEASFELAKIYHKALNQPQSAIPHYLVSINKTKENKRIAAALLSDCYLAIGDMNGAKLVLEQYAGVTIEEVEGR